MKVEYDVKVPHNTYGKAPYAEAFYEFYESGHENAKLEFENAQKALNCQKAVLTLLSRKRIYDVIVTRRQNVVYLVRSDINA